MIGRRLGGFEIVEEIGRGGMGVVYRARQLSLDRDVAFKTLASELTIDEAALERFRHEAHIAARINHPNLVQIHDVGREDDVHYFAMELVPGESLEKLIRREGPLDYRQACLIAKQIADGLGALHAGGIVHRDLKPSNILLTSSLVVKISDFGVSRLQGSAAGLTRDGRTVGTAYYMSPEQARGDEVDGRSDIYSFGIVLYQMLAGDLPFTGDTPLAVMRKQCDEAPPSIRRSRPDIPDRLAEIVAKCLEKDPAERHQSAEALSAELDHVRLELEFAALSAETPAEGAPSAYGTQTVLAMRSELAAQRGPLGRLWRRVTEAASSLLRHGVGTLDRDLLALRRAGAAMEATLAALAQAKQKRSQLRKQAARYRENAEQARSASAEAFDAGDTARAEDLAEDEKRHNDAAIDFESAAQGLDDGIATLEERYRKHRDEHERLRLLVEIKDAQAVQRSLDRLVREPHRRKTPIVVAGAVALLCLVLLAVTLLWFGSRGSLEPAPRPPRPPDAQPPPRPAPTDPARLILSQEQIDAARAANVEPVTAIDLGSGVTMRMVYIPPGEFLMGSADDQAPREEDESPQHRVRFTRGFYAGMHEVTRRQFKAFVEASKYETEAEREGWAEAWVGPHWAKVNGASWKAPGFSQGDDHPVVEVSWNDARAFCDWLGEKAGGIRLPTEAEWEYICKAGTQTSYHWGDRSAEGQGWCNVADAALRQKSPRWATVDWTDGYAFTAPVGSFKPNPWGLFDLHGNAWEWCLDGLREYVAAIRPIDDPRGPETADRRVLRGGSWDNLPDVGRSANRADNSATYRYYGLGFRCVMTVRTAPAAQRGLRESRAAPPGRPDLR